MKKYFEERLLKLNIQMFAADEEGGAEAETAEDNGLDNLMGELGEGQEPKTDEPKGEEPDKDEEPKSKEGEQVKEGEPAKKDETKNDADDDEEKVERKKENPIKQMRDSLEAEKKKSKELETEREQFQKTQEKLARAIKLGIKGETVEEILENLENYDVKKEAETKGLTEAQILKEKEIEERMSKLTNQEQEVLFNRRAYTLQVKRGLTEDQINDFVTEAAGLGINLSTTGADFEKIYDKLNNPESNKIIEQANAEITKLKQEISELKKGRATPRGVKGKPSTTSTGKGNLDQLLNELT